jgi:DNA polymerase III epsilon subunit-like protein
MVADKEPFVESRMKSELIQILSSGNVLVAHNARFDIEMLKREGVLVDQSIDTFKVAYALDENNEIPRYALQYLRYFFGLEVTDATAHSALGDVRVLVAVFEFLYAKMYEQLGDEEKVIEEMIALSSRPLMFRTFTFGKYTGRSIKEVASSDPGYVAWLLNQKIMNREKGEDDDENWIYTLDFYLKK